MVVYFNELTLDRAPQQNYRLLKDFKKVWTEFSEATDKKIKRMILPHSAMEQLVEAVSSSGDGAMWEFMCFFSEKFHEAQEDENSSDVDDRFNVPKYYIELEDGEKVECKSLGWAALNKSITLGLQSSEFWRKLCYDIEEESAEDETSEQKVLCITELNHINRAEVKTWIAVNREFEDTPEPIPCSLPYEQRKQPSFNIPHHENEKLKAFSDRIVRHQYVCGVVDTLPFDSTTSRFVLRCYEDGKIDIRLHWTKKGCGLKLQTVGRDKKQTELIGEILKDKYDRTS